MRARTPKLAATDSLTVGLVGHEQLPPELLDRITAIHEVASDVASDVLPRPLGQWIDDFRRDIDPEREVIVWEQIAAAYKDMTQGANAELSRRRQAMSALIMLTTGMSPELIAEHSTELDSRRSRRRW
jgi:hypothetical protein